MDFKYKLFFPLFLFVHLLGAQIDEDFYKGFWIVGISSQPTRPQVGIQFFEFSKFYPKTIDKPNFEVRTRLLPEFLGIGAEYREPPIFSVAEWRVGFNVKSRDKYNWGIMFNPLNIWRVGRQAFATTGFTNKIDCVISDNLMIRHMFSLDFSLKPSNKSAKGFIMLNSLELITTKRFFVAVDYFLSRVDYFDESQDGYNAKRFELRLGFRLF